MRPVMSKTMRSSTVLELIVLIVGFGEVLCQRSPLTIQFTDTQPDASLNSIDDESRSDSRPVWLPFPQAIESSNADVTDHLADNLDLGVYVGERFPTGLSRELRQRSKKYKLSFYDCISLYCGDRVGPERGQCILRFCHRT